MTMPFLSVRTASCLAALACALAALTFAARAEGPAAAAAAPAPAASQTSPATCPKPAYPPEAKQAHWTGVSTVAFLIGIDGSVRDTRILKSSGHTILDDAALATLKACSFRPATKNGHRVEAWQPVQFAWTPD